MRFAALNLPRAARRRTGGTAQRELQQIQASADVHRRMVAELEDAIENPHRWRTLPLREGATLRARQVYLRQLEPQLHESNRVLREWIEELHAKL